MNSPHYTIRQINYIRQHYSGKSATELAQELSKSRGSIENCIKRYGISKRTHANAYVYLPTGEFYPSGAIMSRATGIPLGYLKNVRPGEIRQTPAGAVRLASKSEVEQWKQKNGK